MPRSTRYLIEQAEQLADAFEAYEPSDGDRGEPAVLALRRAAYRRALAERDLVEAVRHAREASVSWALIGEQLGTSGEAARQRFAGLVESTSQA